MSKEPCGATPEIEHKGTTFSRDVQPFLLPKPFILQKNSFFLHFSLEIFGHIKKKQYLCKLFRLNGANMHAYI